MLPFLFLLATAALCCSIGPEHTPDRLWKMTRRKGRADVSVLMQWPEMEFVAAAKVLLLAEGRDGLFPGRFGSYLKAFPTHGGLKKYLFALLWHLASEGHLPRFSVLACPDYWTEDEHFSLLKAHLSSGARVIHFAIHFSDIFNSFVKRNCENIYDMVSVEDMYVIQCHMLVFNCKNPTVKFSHFVAKEHKALRPAQLMMACLSLQRFDQTTDLKDILRFFSRTWAIAHSIGVKGDLKEKLRMSLISIAITVLIDFNLTPTEFQRLHKLFGKSFFGIIAAAGRWRYFRLLFDSPFYLPANVRGCLDNLENNDGAWNLFFFENVAKALDSPSDLFRMWYPGEERNLILFHFWVLRHNCTLKPLQLEDPVYEKHDLYYSALSFILFDTFEDYFEKNRDTRASLNYLALTGCHRQAILDSKGDLQQLIDGNGLADDEDLELLCCLFSEKPQTALACLERAVRDNQVCKAKFLGHHLLKTFPATLEAVISSIMSASRKDAAMMLDEFLNAHPFTSNQVCRAVAPQKDAFPLILDIFSPCEDLESAVVPGEGLVIVEAVMRLETSRKVRKIFCCFGIWSTIRIVHAFVTLTSEN